MFKIQISLKDYKIKEYNKNLLKAIDLGMNDLADFIGTKSDAILRGNELGGSQLPAHPGSVDTGMLAKSLVVDKSKEYEKIVAYEAPHGVYVEFGTKPHYPPLKPIYEWVMRQRSVLGVVPRTKVESRSPRMRALYPVYYREIMAPTMAIVQTIGKEGSEAKPFLRPAVNIGKINSKAILRNRIEKFG